MLLSILIPTYNNEDEILKSVNSALKQDYDEQYEVIVANNASTDGTGKVLAEINDSKLRVITNPTTVSATTNHGVLLKAAKSDYVVFLHADDELLPDALKIISYKIKERLYPKRYILWGHSLYADVSEWWNGIHSMITYNTMISGVIAKRLMLANLAPQPTGTCYSREALLDIDGFWGGETCSDWAVCAWASYNCFEFEMSDRIWLKRTNSGTFKNWSVEKKKKKMIMQCQGVWDKCEQIGMTSDIVELYNIYDLSYWDNFFFERGTKKDKLNIIKRQIKRNPRNVRKWAKYMWVLMRY